MAKPQGYEQDYPEDAMHVVQSVRLLKFSTEVSSIDFMLKYAVTVALVVIILGVITILGYLTWSSGKEGDA